MLTVAHVFQDVGCNKEVEDQRIPRLLAVTAGCAEMESQCMAAISPTRAGSSGFLGAFADRLTQIKNQRGASKLPPKHPGCASRLTLRYPGKAASTLS
jgi:hypothetical protein